MAQKEVVNTDLAPAPIGPYNQAIKANGFLFVSGQVALVPGTGDLNDATIQEEMHQVMKNISAILDQAGLGFNDLVKTTIFLSDMALFAEVNDIYGSYFTGHYPARETVAVKGLPKNVHIEISVTAVFP